MNHHEINCRGEDAVTRAGGKIGRDGGDSNLTSTSKKDDYPIDDISEQYRIMAQMEANIRVKDNTGFDMAEYKQQLEVLEEERQRKLSQEKRQHYIKPKPRLPDAQQVSGGFGGNDGSLPGEGSSRPEEPPLPFTRANRRYIQTGRGIHNREKVPEIGRGIVVSKNSLTGTAIGNGKEQVVNAWDVALAPTYTYG
eukprot:CAMPEP_0197185344 /NCGR_PEP_ID=MMETSP1423-20130617/11763_1 /TAXON_ID=476441 /ORGANISM="Pseudo-nitzschia heimii, Strain UNC1101" /LENGTH=194 /DNA_ID=CAMNT_0042636379 /DNA_START=25 /DNA_END=610 /DNA_ORIENTATION=-